MNLVSENLQKNHFFEFPNIDPVAFSSGPLKVHWYGLGYLTGILLGYFYLKLILKKNYLWKNEKPAINNDQLSDFILWAAIGIVIGGRLGDILLWDTQIYLSNPLEIFKIWHGGMAFHGGLIGLIIVSFIFAKINKISFLSLIDLVSAAAPIGLGIVRICNFINGELYGKVTQVYWAVVFPHGGNLPRHPSQIYESFLEGFVLFLLLIFAIFIFKSLKKPGLTAGLFSLLYGTARIVCEFFRDKDPAPYWFDYLFKNSTFSYGMFLSIPMIIIGCILIFYSFKKSKA